MISKELIKKVRQIQITTNHMVNDVFAGQYQSVFKGQGMEFHEVREYMPGDDIRTIDWNVTARTGKPFIKKFVEEREMTVMLMVDVSGSLDFGSTSQLKKNLAAELAALLAFSAIKNNDRVGLILFSDRVEHYIPPQKGVRHVLRVISEVLQCEPESKKTDLVPALDFMNHVTTRKSVCFLISDFFFDRQAAQRGLNITAKKHDLVGVVVGDKRETSWPRVGLVDWVDAETGETYLVDTSDKATRHALTSMQRTRRDDLLKQLARSGIDAVEVNAGESYTKEFIKFFKKRERRLGM